MAFSHARSQSGDGPFVTPRISRPWNTGQPSRASSSIVTATGDGYAPGTGSTARGRNVPSPRAARSRAIPWTPSASGRFGVIATSITGSTAPGRCSASQSAKLSPTSPDGSSMIPSCSSDSSISRSEAIIPKLSTPLILDAPMVVSIPGT